MSSTKDRILKEAHITNCKTMRRNVIGSPQ
ncbi:hypothetical protein A2U01_0099148, partial [Trifolium medium]|nr:hypothetical protein [Trifolium medium]